MVGVQTISGLAIAAGLVLVTAGLEAAPGGHKRVALVPSPAPVEASIGSAAASSRCPRNMARVADGKHAFCIDQYEASVVEVGPTGKTTPHSPYEAVTGLKVRALSTPGVVPQGYISGTEAKAACENAGKRLCAPSEWEMACRGAEATKYPYGDEEVHGKCNAEERKVHPVVELFQDAEGPFASFEKMNDPRINQMPHTVAKTGARASCRSSYGVFDMVGNLHEWTADPKGQFNGGYFMDTHQNGDGCGYRTRAHDRSYHDYSTGFRCCK